MNDKKGFVKILLPPNEGGLQIGCRIFLLVKTHDRLFYREKRRYWQELPTSSKASVCSTAMYIEKVNPGFPGDYGNQRRCGLSKDFTTLHRASKEGQYLSYCSAQN